MKQEVYGIKGSCSITEIDGEERWDIFCPECGHSPESMYDTHFCKPLGVEVIFI